MSSIKLNESTINMFKSIEVAHAALREYWNNKNSNIVFVQDALGRYNAAKLEMYEAITLFLLEVRKGLNDDCYQFYDFETPQMISFVRSAIRWQSNENLKVFNSVSDHDVNSSLGVLWNWHDTCQEELGSILGQQAA